MKFPSEECKQKANAAIKWFFAQDPQFLVSKPRKLKPRMTIVGIPVSLPDGKTVISIVEKST